MQEYEREFSQVHRMDLYNRALQNLRDKGTVFACTCSRADVLRMSAENIYSGTCLEKKLPLHTPVASWRLHTSATQEITVKNLWADDVQTTLPVEMQYFIVKKRDGFPAYQLTSLIDDIHFGVDLVVRGEDLWPSTIAQAYLAKILDLNEFQNTTFYHHPLLLDSEGKKLSKSLGATSVQYFRKLGHKPRDIYALIAHILGLQAEGDGWRDLATMVGL